MVRFCHAFVRNKKTVTVTYEGHWRKKCSSFCKQQLCFLFLSSHLTSVSLFVLLSFRFTLQILCKPFLPSFHFFSSNAAITLSTRLYIVMCYILAHTQAHILKLLVVPVSSSLPPSSWCLAALLCYFLMWNEVCIFRLSMILMRSICLCPLMCVQRF